MKNVKIAGYGCLIPTFNELSMKIMKNIPTTKPINSGDEDNSLLLL